MNNDQYLQDIVKMHEFNTLNFEERTGLKEGAQVRYIGTTCDLQARGYGGGYTDPRGVLDLETIYEIECVVVGRSWSFVKLVGFGKMNFNSVVFQPVDREEKKKSLTKGGRVRFVSKAHDLLSNTEIRGLDNETIYEVEWIESHPSALGYKYVKLVGIEGLFYREHFEKVRDE